MLESRYEEGVDRRFLALIDDVADDKAGSTHKNCTLAQKILFYIISTHCLG